MLSAIHGCDERPSQVIIEVQLRTQLASGTCVSFVLSARSTRPEFSTYVTSAMQYTTVYGGTIHGALRGEAPCIYSNVRFSYKLISSTHQIFPRQPLELHQTKDYLDLNSSSCMRLKNEYLTFRVSLGRNIVLGFVLRTLRERGRRGYEGRRAKRLKSQWVTPTRIIT
jgi:hypothetical protein